MESEAATAWLIAFSRKGGARYLSHLDTARALQRTLARAGVGLALSQGMRPKPRLSLGLPLPVGVEGLFELAVAAVADPGGDERSVLDRLQTAAPPGIQLLSIESRQQPVKLRPELAVYEGALDTEREALAEAVSRFLASSSVQMTRARPKGDRLVDVRRSVDRLMVCGGGEPDARGHLRLGFAIRHLRDGAARPGEVLGALVDLGARAPGTRDAAGRPAFTEIVRIGVTYAGMKPRGPVEEWLETYVTRS